VLQDPPLELLQRVARIEAKLLPELCAPVGHHRERVRLAPTAVEGKHEQPAGSLPQRILAHQRLQLGHGLDMTTHLEVGLKAQLERDQPRLLQPADRTRGEGLVAEVEERLPPPQQERLPQNVAGFLRCTLLEEPPSVSERLLEALQIQRTRLELQHVAELAGYEHAGAERLAQLRDVDLERLHGAPRRTLPPERVDEPLLRHRLAGVEQQHGEQRALLGRP